MRLQVNLLRDVRIRVLAEVVLEQGHGDHQWHDAVAVLANNVLHFLFVFGAYRLFEITADVLQDIAVGAPRGALFQGCHQLAEIARADGVRLCLTHGAQQVAQGFVLHRVMSHQLVFVA